MPAIIKPSRLSCAVQTEAVAGGGLTTVSAFVLFDFADPRRLLTEQALWPMVVEQMPKGAIFDKGQLKPKGELIIGGAALAPTDRPITGCRVTARLGAIEKRLAVFGDRFWRLTDHGIEMLDAKPFDRMQIDEAHAFGGPNHKGNPRGKGHGARSIAEAGYDAPLPNVEDARHLIRSIDDNPASAHFGPLAPDYAGRIRYAGTYDQHWIKNVAPMKPEDFNPLFRCDAPEDQRLDGYLQGNEAFTVSGMSRGEAAVGGHLPGLRARAFVHRPADDSFTEIRMVCDTVTLFPNVTKATLAFRGLVKSQDRFGDDIGTVMLALEHLEAEPRPQEYYLHVLRLRRDPEQAHKHALSDFQLMPEVDASIISERRRQKLERAREERIRFMENQNWGARKAVESVGMPPEIVPPVDYSLLDELPLVAIPTSEEIERGDVDIAEMLDDVKTLEAALKQKSDIVMARAEHYRRALVNSAPSGANLPAIALKPVVDDEHLARFPELTLEEGFDQAIAELETAFPSKDSLLASLNSGLTDEELATVSAQIDRAFGVVGEDKGVDPEVIEKQFRLACARALKEPEGSVFHDMRGVVDGLSLDSLKQGTGAGDDPSQREFAALFDSLMDSRSEAGDAGIDREGLYRALPAGADRRPVEDALGKANEKVSAMVPWLIEEGHEGDAIGGLLAKIGKIAPPIDPADADLTIGQHLDKRKQSASDRLDEAEAQMDEAMVTGRQMMPAAMFPMEPFLPGVDARFGAFVKEKLAQGHDFRGADLAGADLCNVDFSGRDLSATFFEKANLSGARFVGANLEGAAFTEAILDGADFTGARLSKANLNKASLKGAVLDRCEASDLTVMEADFSRVSARNMRLSNTRIINCVLDEADFSGAEIPDLQLLQGRADELRLDGARIERAAFMMLSMKGASFVGSELERVVFTEIAAPGASFKEARMRTVGFLGACDLTGGRFERLVAEETSWNTTRLVESCFLRAHCHTCLFNDCDMTASDFRLASLKNSRFVKAVLVDSDMFGANLFSGSLTQSDLRRTSLRGANLYFADLIETKLASSDLSGANLGGTLMERPAHA